MGTPRLLTPDEIGHIVDQAVPPLFMLDKQNRELAVAQLGDWIRRELRTIKLVPEGIPLFINQVRRQIELSQAPPGMPAGHLAAEALAASATQLVLNIFKSYGRQGADEGGVRQLNEVLMIREKRQYKRTTIYFEAEEETEEGDIVTVPARMTFAEALATRETLEEILVSQVIRDSREFVNIQDPDMPFEEPWWYEVYGELTKTNIVNLIANGDVTILLRLALDLQVLWNQGIEVAEVAEAIEGIGYTIAIPSPQNIGWIDLYVKEDYQAAIQSVADNVSADIYERTFFSNFLIPSLDKIAIKGIRGLANIFPTAIPIRSILVAQEFKLGTGRYQASVSKRRLYVKGIDLQELVDLYEATEVTVGTITETVNTWEVELECSPLEELPEVVEEEELPEEEEEEEEEDTSDEELDEVLNRAREFLPPVVSPFAVAPELKIYTTPKEHLDFYLTQEDRAKARAILAAKKADPTNKYPNIEPGLITTRSEFYIIETEDRDTVKLQDLFSLPGIDANRTTGNNFYQTAAVLGIHAFRTLQITELLKIVQSSGGDINTNHILLMADFSCQRGIPVGVGVPSIAKRNNGWFSDASYRSATAAVAKGAIINSHESASTTSTAIALGQDVSLGTGGPFTVLFSPEKELELLTEMGRATEAGVYTEEEEEGEKEEGEKEEEEEEGIINLDEEIAKLRDLPQEQIVTGTVIPRGLPTTKNRFVLNELRILDTPQRNVKSWRSVTAPPPVIRRRTPITSVQVAKTVRTSGIPVGRPKRPTGGLNLPSIESVTGTVKLALGVTGEVEGPENITDE